MEMVNSSKRLKNTTHEETIDFISKLQDHILVHILSFLPTEDAIKTVLLRRFGNLWRSVPVLDINACKYHPCLFVAGYEEKVKHFNYADQERIYYAIIRNVSDLHDVGILDKVSLKVHFSSVYVNDHPRSVPPMATAGHIDMLVGYAINRKVKVLDLNFKGCLIVSSWELYALPNVFRSNYLTDMRLVCCNIKACREIRLKELRVLLLDSVFLSKQVMENILIGCPFLEDLSLVDCYGLGKLYCKNYPNLKKLMLNLHRDRTTLLCVSCPHVMSLEITDWTVGATLEDVTSPIDAYISFESLFCYKHNREYDGCDQRLLRMISLCKTITLSDYTVLMLSLWNVRNVPCASYQWKNLIINLKLTKWHYPGLSWLLKSRRFLETLTMHIDRNEDGFFSPHASRFISHGFDSKSFWNLQEATFPCLECITIHGYVNLRYVDRMLKFLLKNATKLQKMVISIKEVFEAKRCKAGRGKDEYCSSCQVLKLVQDLSVFPKSSSQAVICVSC